MVEKTSPDQTERKMAKYDVTHSCGCTATHQIAGPHSERDKRIAYLETQKCTECWKADNAAKAAQDAAQNAAAGLPALVGSDKQTAWAETIRTKKLTELDAMAAAGNDRFRATLDVLKGKAEAKYWIDTRDTSAQSMAVAVAQAMTL
jgi:hypothetical protein